VTLPNRQWVLKRRPEGALTLDHFAYREVDIDLPQLTEGQVLVRNLVFNCAPTMRNWMNESGRSYRASVALGDAIVGPACAQVVSSADERFAVGSRLIGVSRWEDYSIVEPRAAATPVLSVPPEMSSTDALGLYGLNSLTAYFGLLRVGQPKPGETLVVSAAAGSVGSMVVQLGVIHGCRVIAIAGGQEKCTWLSSACGAHGAIDYKAEDVAQRLVELAPDGVNVFFDNVGGHMLQVLTDHMAVHGRIVLCGQVSAYDRDEPAPGPRDMMRVVYGRLTIRGFVLGDFLAEAHAARAELMNWEAQGRIVRHEDVRSGFTHLPAAFLNLFAGANRGTLLVKVA
jgi:NADPH-dependent curcumin reductase CurA